MNSPSTSLGVGETLRARRRQRNLTLEFVSQETRIQLRFLKALEDEKWDEFPARVYLEGFLKKYAAVLGLEADELVKRFREATAPREEGGAAPAPRAPSRRAPVDDGSDPRQPPLVLFFFLAVVAGIYFYTSHMDKPAPATATAPSASAPESTPAASAASTPPAAPASAPLPPGSLRFGLRARQTVSLRAWVDGRLRFEGLVRAGTSKSWVGTKNFRVTASDAAAVEVFADGEKLLSPAVSGAGDFEWPVSEAGPSVSPSPADVPAP